MDDLTDDEDWEGTGNVRSDYIVGDLIEEDLRKRLSVVVHKGLLAVLRSRCTSKLQQTRQAPLLCLSRQLYTATATRRTTSISLDCMASFSYLAGPVRSPKDVR